MTAATAGTDRRPDGPFAEDLAIGRALPAAPSITLDTGLTAAYQALCGDPSRLPLSTPLCAAVMGRPARLVNAGLALQVAIGQSTVATRRVLANLFYRDVRLHRQVVVDDTLTTVVVPKARERTRSGDRVKVLLAIRTTDQDSRVVAEFERLALLPTRPGATVTDEGAVGPAERDTPLAGFHPAVPGAWHLDALPPTPIRPIDHVTDPTVDSVSGAREWVRLTQNQALAHRDPAHGVGGRRLVYGGHTVALAQAALARLVPSLATVLGWRSCDHLAPVFEDDLVTTTVTEADRLPVPQGLLAGYRVTVAAQAPDGGGARDVLDFRPVCLLAPVGTTR